MFGAGDVFCDVGAGAFGVAHLAEDSAAGGGDAFDGAERAVRVVGDIHGGRAGFVAVLGGDLASGGEFCDDFGAGVEATFAVGERDGVDVADFVVRKPWRQRAGHAGVRVTRDVAADFVVDEGRRVGAGLTDLAVGDEAGFDECLEAVADAEDEAVTFFEQVHDGIRHARAADDGGDEFGGAVGFVAGAEATGEHEDLRLADFFREGCERFLDVARAEVAEDENFWVGSGFAEGFGGVVFAIGTGE